MAWGYVISDSKNKITDVGAILDLVNMILEAIN